MMKKSTLISILVCIMSFSIMAKANLSDIEAQERAQIISELTYRLETKQNCSATLNWDDSGSGADLDGYFFLPDVGNSEYIIGGHASGKRSSKYHCVTTVSIAAGNPEGTPPLLVAPADWKQIWKDSGSGAAKDGSFWTAIPPDNNYKCIGSVSQLFHNKKPNLPNYRCVHVSLTDKIVANNIIWSDKGTGADQQVSVFSLPATTSFIAVSPRANSVETYDLKKNATSVPNPKKVEEILAQRMAPLKAGIEEKTKALQEQKEETRKAEAKQIKDKAEQEKLAAAAEKKKQEEAAQKKIAEEKALAAKAETNAEEEAKQLQEELRLKEEQQARIAKAMEEKAAAEQAQKEKAQIEKTKQEAAKQAAARKEEASKEEVRKEEIKSEPEPEPEAEAIAEEPVKTEAIEKTSASKSKSESKGLDDIMMFFMKVFGMMIGGVIIFMIAFKVLFGKKDK
jgi:DNA segregation ATPase FtsK/SpoIIIE-like protein